MTSLTGEGVNHRLLNKQWGNLMFIRRMVLDVLNNHSNDLSVCHAFRHAVGVEGQYNECVRNTGNVSFASACVALLAVFDDESAVKTISGKTRHTQKAQNQTKSFHLDLSLCSAPVHCLASRLDLFG